MTFPIVRTDSMTPFPTGMGWTYTRQWFATGHPQSGVEWNLSVGQYAVMDEEEAMREVVKLGLPALADKQIFQNWVDVGLHKQ